MMSSRSARPSVVRSAVGPIAAAAALLAGCAGNPEGGNGPSKNGGPPPAPAGPYELGASAAPVRPIAGSPTAAPVTPAAAVQRTAAKAPAAPDVPAGARYTVLCMTFQGPDHTRLAKNWKDLLCRATGRREFYVVHEESGSTLYFGYYREIERANDAKEAARAEQDLAFVRGLGDGDNHLLFPGALKVPLPVPDPEGPPEFDLTKLDADKSPDDPTRRYWSIAIAAYTPDGNYTGADAGKSRKQLAIEVVQEFRKRGVEAYYYNGQNVSTVCIGAWPKEAIEAQTATHAESKADTGEDIVVSTMPLPKELHDQIAASGKSVNVFEPKIDFSAGTNLPTVWKQYPDYYVNGYPQVSHHRDQRTGQDNEKRQSSFLFKIPTGQGPTVPAALASDDADNGNGPTPGRRGPLTPNSGAGRLRSVGP